MIDKSQLNSRKKRAQTLAIQEEVRKRPVDIKK